MVYPAVLYYVFAVALFFISVFVLTPIVYTFWFDHLRDMVQNDVLRSAGDLFWSTFIILAYAGVGILIFWGYSVAARKGTQQEEEQY